jgi:predicted DCC family thiol-disulfide oxidoreductase YuxK
MRISAQKRRHLVLWDGDCGFCRRCVNLLARLELFGALEFEPYQAADISEDLRRACSQAVHVVKRDGEILRGAEAILFCCRFTHFHKLARLLEWRIFRPFLDMAYDLVARHRAFFSRLLYFI